MPSVCAHVAARDGAPVAVAPELSRIANFATLLKPRDGDAKLVARFHDGKGHGQPLAYADFIAGLERIPGRRIARSAPRRKPKYVDELQTKSLQ